MSLVFNMVGGGGDGGLLPTDAILRVQAPAGSTVTITKGTTTKTDLGHENADDHTVYDYYFIIHASQFDSNPWTVTATLSGDTASDTIIIDAADEYDVVLEYYLYLYKDGTYYYPFTQSIQSASAQSITDGADSIVFTSSGFTGTAFGTSNKIDITNYSSLCFEIDFTTAGTSQYQMHLGVKPNTAPNHNSYNVGFSAKIDWYGSSTGIKTVDISNVSGEAYIVMDGGSINGKITKMYLVP